MAAWLADGGARYHIRVQGRLDPRWALRLGDMTLAAHDEGGNTVTDITGWVTDRAALIGMLEQLYSLAVTLLRVERLQEDRAEARTTRPAIAANQGPRDSR
jgi:hypothetical protein